MLRTSDHGIYPFHRRTLSFCLYALWLLHYCIHFSSTRPTSSVTNDLRSGTPLRLAWIICRSSSIDIVGKTHSVVSLLISCERWRSVANETLLVQGLDLLITIRKKHELHHCFILMNLSVVSIVVLANDVFGDDVVWVNWCTMTCNWIVDICRVAFSRWIDTNCFERRVIIHSGYVCHW